MPAQALKRWETKASTGSHFDVLDGLRGMAILLVVCYHSLYTNPDRGGMLAQLINWGIIQPGWMGVPIFFVLSGFLISYPFFQKRLVDPEFWYQNGYALRRIAKIIPPFYLSILLFIGFSRLQSQDPAYLKSALLWATGLGNFVQPDPIFNGSYWSLIVEAHFYILLPFLFWLTRRRSLPATTVLLFLILFAGPMFARLFTWPQGVLVSPESGSLMARQLSLTQTRFPCQLDYFAWGVAFAGVYVSLSTLRDQLGSLSLLGYLGVALLLATLFFWGSWTTQFNIRSYPTRWSVEIAHLLPSLAAMLLLFFVFDPACLGSRFFCQGWLRFTGLISYEWFLLHGPIVAWFHEHNGPSHGNLTAYLWRTIVPLVLTFGLSVLVYRYFSLPILSRVRHRLLATTQNSQAG